MDRDAGPATICRYAKAVIAQDDDLAVLEQLDAVAGPGSALISTSDDWLRFIIRHRARLDAAFAVILHPRNEALGICLDKSAFALWCRSAGLPTPLTWIGIRDKVPDAARFPMLLRPASTLHGNRELGIPKAVQVFDQRELDHWLTRYAAASLEPLVSESLLGRELEQISVSFARCQSSSLLLTARKIRPAPRSLCCGQLCRIASGPNCCGPCGQGRGSARLLRNR